jgi:hypothetical protein
MKMLEANRARKTNANQQVRLHARSNHTATQWSGHRLQMQKRLSAFMATYNAENR